MLSESTKNKIASCVNDKWGGTINYLMADRSAYGFDEHEICRITKLLAFNLLTAGTGMVGFVVVLANRKLEILPFSLRVFAIVAPLLLLRYCLEIAIDKTSISTIQRGLDASEATFRKGTASPLKLGAWISNTRGGNWLLNQCGLKNVAQNLEDTAESIETSKSRDKFGGRSCYLGLFKTFPADFRERMLKD